MKKQYLLIVDTNDNFTGKYEEKLLCHTGEGLHHRAFITIIFNNKDEVLLQKRKHFLWDSYWDITATSHVLHLPTHDESYEAAATRCLENEMGIGDVILKKIGSFNYFAKENEFCENEYCAILTGQYIGKVSADPKTVYKYQWVSRDWFYIDCQKNPQKYTPWALQAVAIISKQ